MMRSLENEGGRSSVPDVMADWMRDFFQKNPTGSFTIRTIVDATGFKKSTVKNAIPFISGIEKTQRSGADNVYTLIEGAPIEFTRQGNSGRLPQCGRNRNGSGLRGLYHTETIHK